ncbi:hypothetical protein [Vibrio parahaemolyticus]|uniref:hypothetical protein n=1 Tax=Vibrio parahaemolyticus TaxID=670 RepID=UPI00330619F5
MFLSSKLGYWLFRSLVVIERGNRKSVLVANLLGEFVGLKADLLAEMTFSLVW